MKTGFDTFRESAIKGVMKRIEAHEGEYLNFSRAVNDLKESKQISDIIVANQLFR